MYNIYMMYLLNFMKCFATLQPAGKIIGLKYHTK